MSRCEPRGGVLASAVQMSNLTPLVVEDVEGDAVGRWRGPGRGRARRCRHHRGRSRPASEAPTSPCWTASEGGGATAISGGVFYAGGGTHIQERSWASTTRSRTCTAICRWRCRTRWPTETLRRLLRDERGQREVVDRPRRPVSCRLLCPVKTSYPTNEYHLYYSGNETFPPYSDHAKPAQRGHRADGGAFPGFNIVEPLRQTAIRVGSADSASVARQSADRRRIRDVSWVLEYQHLPSKFLANAPPAVAPPRDNGRQNCDRACRLVAQARRLRSKTSTPRRGAFDASKGPILCAGGFIFNREMVAEHLPEFVPGLTTGHGWRRRHGNSAWPKRGRPAQTHATGLRVAFSLPAQRVCRGRSDQRQRRSGSPTSFGTGPRSARPWSKKTTALPP